MSICMRLHVFVNRYKNAYRHHWRTYSTRCSIQSYHKNDNEPQQLYSPWIVDVLVCVWLCLWMNRKLQGNEWNSMSQQFSKPQTNLIELKMSFVSFEEMKYSQFFTHNQCDLFWHGWIWSIVGQPCYRHINTQKNYGLFMGSERKQRRNWQVYRLPLIIFRIMEVKEKNAKPPEILISCCNVFLHCTCGQRWIRMKNTCVLKNIIH